MRHAVLVPVLGLALGMSLLGAMQASGAKAPTPVAATPAQVDNFRLVTATGHSEDLYRYRDAPAVVLAMYGVGSPEIRKLAPALERLNSTYAPKGVLPGPHSCWGSNPKGKPRANCRLGAESNALGLTMPVLMDDNQLAGGQLGAERVSEVFVIDPRSWKVVYRGALGDAQAGAARALDALLAGKPVAVAQIPATGTRIASRTAAALAKASRPEDLLFSDHRLDHRGASVSPCEPGRNAALRAGQLRPR